MKANLVCKGGGVKGIALVGAISHLEQQGYEWNNLAGTSAGSMVAALLAVGYNSKEIKEILYEVDFNNFNGNSSPSFFYLSEITRLLVKKGIHSGEYIEDFMREKLKAKGKLKFRDISKNGESKLKIIASDVTRKKLLILPDDLVDYGLDPLDFEIATAVRMSTCIPFYYTPISLNYNNKKCFIVDGGLLSNFPIWLFDEEEYSYPTFGLNLTDEDSLDLDAHTNIITYFLDVVFTSLATNEDVYYREKDFARIINIPTLNINPTDFNLSKEDKDKLFKSGFNSAKSFIKDWNFDRYLSRYCTRKNIYKIKNT